MSKQVKRLRTLNSNKKGSIEIGINTIVIMVIAIVLLGLGIGFVKGIFGKMSSLPDLIDVDDMTNPPTSSDPIKLSPASIEVKRGNSKEVVVGVYNKEETDKTFSIDISECSKGDIPDVETLSATIPSGEAKGFKVIVNAKEGDVDLSTGKRICKLVATAEDTSYEAQFYITVTN